MRKLKKQIFDIIKVTKYESFPENQNKVFYITERILELFKEERQKRRIK